MRPIKFRAWDGKKMHKVCRLGCEGFSTDLWSPSPVACESKQHGTLQIMQFTGLHDKNGLAEIYEGDIIDANGILKGNIYESPQIYQEGVDCLIEGVGTEKWRNTESVAMGRGCKYAK